MSSPITTALADGILTISLSRPEKKNAITQAMYAELAQAVVAARENPQVRVVLLRGEGDSFSAGNDIADFITQAGQADAPKDAADWPVFRFLRSLADMDKPIVGAVQGRAVGIGLTMLLHCDLVVVADDALLSVPFVNLALAPEAASSLLLPMVVGHARAFEMFALGEPISGQTALDWGLANRAVPAGEVEVVARDLAQRLAQRAPNSIRKTKALMRDAEAMWTLMLREGEAFGSQMRSPEAMEAFMAFQQKRPANFG